LKALLLAAGLGTRLRPLTDKIPKCLLPINGKPLLAYWLDLLFPAGIAHALINTHHLPDQVRRFHGVSPWRSRTTLVHEAELLGTAGTMIANRAFFGTEAFMLVHADNLSRFSVPEFMRVHRERPSAAAITMMTFETDAPQSCGIVELDAAGLVTHFHEKVANPPGTRANGAVYIVEPEVVQFAASLGRQFLDFSTDIIPRFLGRITTYHNTNYHRDVGTPESLRAAEREFPLT
jgi:mannose-1-phosphate guanylyltransferase